MKTNLWQLALGFPFLLGTPVWAGFGAHGGGGVIENGKPFVLDLVESGFEHNPFFGKTIAAEPDDVERIAVPLATVPNVPIPLIVHKIAEIRVLDPILAEAILQTANLYTWRALDFSIIHISDEDTVLNIPYENQVQLAARHEHSVTLNRDAWNELDDANRAALVIHEILYALQQDQSSPRAREVVGFLFSPEIVARGRDYLHMLGGLPRYFEDSDKLGTPLTWKIAKVNGKNYFAISPEIAIECYGCGGVGGRTEKNSIQEICKAASSSRIKASFNFTITAEYIQLWFGERYYTPVTGKHETVNLWSTSMAMPKHASPKQCEGMLNRTRAENLFRLQAFHAIGTL